MILMPNPQTFKTPSGDEMVILTKAEYDALIDAADDAAEDAADAAIYAERKAALASGEDVVLPPAMSVLITKGYTRLAAVRRLARVKRTQVDVAECVGISQAYLSALESGERRITEELAQKLAELYDVPEKWIAP